MPTLRKTFIISLTIALSSLVYFGFIELLYILDGNLITNEDFLDITISIHFRIAMPVFYIGLWSAGIAIGCAGLIWMRRSAG